MSQIFLDVSQLPSNLKDYSQQNNSRIYRRMYLKSKFKTYMTPLIGVDQIPMVNMRMTDLVKPGGVDSFTPVDKPVSTFSRTMQLRACKADVKINPTDIEKMWASYIGTIATNTRNNVNDLPQPFAGYVFDEIMQKVDNNIGQAAINGVYNAVGTTPLDTLNGLKKTLQLAIGLPNGIPAYNIMPLTAVTDANAVAEVKKLIDLVETVAPQYLTEDLILIVGPKFHRCYKRNYAATNNASNRAATLTFDQDVVEEQPNIRFVVEPMLGNSSAMILTTPGNISYGTDNLGRFNLLKIEEFERSIKVMMDWKMGIEFAIGEDIWCNNPLDF